MKKEAFYVLVMLALCLPLFTGVALSSEYPKPSNLIEHS